MSTVFEFSFPMKSICLDCRQHIISFIPENLISSTNVIVWFLADIPFLHLTCMKLILHTEWSKCCISFLFLLLLHTVFTYKRENNPHAEKEN